ATPGLVVGPGGAMDILIGRTAPRRQAVNWLPAPRNGPFALVLRAYGPRPALLERRYALGPVTPIAPAAW
ncbi:MAG: DUF1214 domain-containing protein, partial [Caulobacteraceae bacterium]